MSSNRSIEEIIGINVDEPIQYENKSHVFCGVGLIESVNVGNNIWIQSCMLNLRGAAVGNKSIIGAGNIILQNGMEAGVLANVVSMS